MLYTLYKMGVDEIYVNGFSTSLPLRRPIQSVKFISEDETKAIYKFQYWDRVQGDFLPRGLDYAVFDFAVNSGVGRGRRYP